ncbi:hypothetical protein [Kalamiella sp. sgz302252]|uniref:hypothetical protein n=1 Tax=Pantoea sp. sgz302252 TaxID=3341827 RepID=UPI0036D3B0A8
MNIQPTSSGCAATTRTLSPAENPLASRSFRKSIRRVANTWNDKLRKASTYILTKSGVSGSTENDSLTGCLDNKKTKKRLAQPESSINFSHLKVSREKISLQPDLAVYSPSETTMENRKFFLAEGKVLNPIAIFGFGDDIFHSACFVKWSVNAIQPLITMPWLNKSIGLSNDEYYDCKNMADKYFCLINSLVSFLDKDKPFDCSPNSFLTPEFLQEWKGYLKERKQKLDIFARLARESDPVAKEIRLKKLIAKNTGGDTDMEQFFYFIKNNFFSCANSHEVVKKLETMKSDKNWVEMGPLIHSMYKFVDKHFFRNTSKLGLAFLQSKGFDFIFADNGRPDGKVLNAKDLAMKKYHHYERNCITRDGEKIQIWEPITFSEARFINKNLPLFKDSFIRVRCDEETIRMAKWGDDNWLEHPRAAFRKLKMYARK